MIDTTEIIITIKKIAKKKAIIKNGITPVSSIILLSSSKRESFWIPINEDDTLLIILNKFINDKCCFLQF